MQTCSVDTHVSHSLLGFYRVIKSHQRSCWSQWAVSGPGPAPTLQVVQTNTGPRTCQPAAPQAGRAGWTAQSSLECRRVNTSVPRVRASNNTHPWPLVTRPNLWGLWQVHHDVRVRRPQQGSEQVSRKGCERWNHSSCFVTNMDPS